MEKFFSSAPIDYAQTEQFSNLILDYLSNDEKMASFYAHRPSLESFQKAIELKNNKKVNRTVLKNVLLEQYQNIAESDRGEAVNIIKSLENEKTYTVTTGHQLCMFTGPLYFIYKLISTIRLAGQLKQKYPENNFVPVYWMASEDHDFDEINHIHVFSKKITWEQDQKGATGKIQTSTLNVFLSELKEVLGNSINADYLISLFEKSYREHSNLADSMRSLVHSLFGKYGLIIIDPDHSELKKEFVSIMKDDLFNHHSFKLVNQANKRLEEHYKIQVEPREINLFYLSENSRERIISQSENVFEIKNTALTFTKEQIMELLSSNPEKFSPNVVLRPLYQEVILPNLAYIGGPGEIAYWLQYKEMFDFYITPFPVLILRNCLLVLEKDVLKKLSGLNVKPADIFNDIDSLIKQFLKNNVSVNENLNYQTEKEELMAVFSKLKKNAESIDSTLIPFISGEEQKALNAITTLEQKIIKSEKKRHEVAINQLKNIKEKLFPTAVPQERYYNFSMFYLKYGENFISYLMSELDPLQLKYLIIKEE